MFMMERGLFMYVNYEFDWKKCVNQQIKYLKFQNNIIYSHGNKTYKTLDRVKVSYRTQKCGASRQWVTHHHTATKHTVNSFLCN